MTGGTFAELDFQGVRIVAIYAGVVRFYVIKTGIVGFVGILVTAHDCRAVLGGRGREVMNIGKAQIFTHYILVRFRQTGIDDGIIHLNGRGSTLMALDTTGFRP